MDSEKDFKVCKSLAWAACNKFQKLWHSNLPNEYNVFLSQSLVGPVLLYGAETWTLTQTTQKKAGRDIHEPSSPGTEHSLVRACNKGEVIRKPNPISDTLMRRRLQFAGHCLRALKPRAPYSQPKDDVPANIIEGLGRLGR